MDGHKRHAWCSLLGRPYEVEYKEFASEQEVLDYIWELHYARRKLQRSAEELLPGLPLSRFAPGLGRQPLKVQNFHFEVARGR